MIAVDTLEQRRRLYAVLREAGKPLTVTTLCRQTGIGIAQVHYGLAALARLDCPCARQLPDGRWEGLK
jgi:hypothetical protein